jgi:rhodanese-related sulfurtransferase
MTGTLKTIPELVAEIRPNMRCINATEARKEMANIKHLFIDVREPAEVAENPAPGSINIPRGVIEMCILEQCTDANKPLYIHCATGARATLAAEQLKRLGYQKVTIITCGLENICAV